MKKDTIVLYPSPGKTHLTPMVELGKLILHHHPSISVAIVVSVTPRESESVDSYLSSFSAATPSISFLRLPGLIPIPSDFSCPENYIVSTFEFARLNNPTLRDTLISLTSTISNVKAFVIDFFCTASCQVSTSLNIPTYYFNASGASGIAFLLYLPALDKKYPGNFKDMDARELVEVPGFPLLSPRDLPFVLTDKSLKAYRWFYDMAVDMSRSAGIIANSFDKLEPRALNAIRDGLCLPHGSTPPTYCIGPLVSSGKDSGARHECLAWLDEQPDESVLFLCFGSMGVLGARQLKEVAVGLEKSGVRFLWVVRIPPPHDQERRGEKRVEGFLPDGFWDRTAGKGHILDSWAPQVDILNHRSVGGFVTHCGWNSLLEAVCAGVPMLGWPLYAEQKRNQVYLVEEMKAGLAVNKSEDGIVSANELEAKVKQLMFDEEGRVLRERVLGMKKEAIDACDREDGSSVAALAEFIRSIGGDPPGSNHKCSFQ